MVTYRVLGNSSVNAMRQVFAPAVNAFKPTGNVEIRSSEGDIWRLKQGSIFEVKETFEGNQPIITGEVFSIITNSWHKNVVSCHTCKLHSSPPVISLVRPSKSKAADEYLCFQGEFIIHEFDESGRHFTITDAEAGDFIEVEYDDKQGMRSRYSVSKRKMTDQEIEMIISEYIDPRKWSW